MGEEELLSLLQKSRENNFSRNITGFLLYNEGNFIQLLEGSRREVKEVFLKISEDDRHHGIMRLIEEYAEVRDFPDWSMGYKRIDDSMYPDHIEGLNSLLDRKNYSDDEFQKISIKIRRLISSFRIATRVHGEVDV